MNLIARERVTPASAGWEYVGFEVVTVRPGESVECATGSDEHCVVIVTGTCSVGDFKDLGGRSDPWSGLPDAAYLPPGTRYVLEGEAEVAICIAPARDGADARILPGADIEVETRGHGAQERTIRPILMADQEADSEPRG